MLITCLITRATKPNEYIYIYVFVTRNLRFSIERVIFSKRIEITMFSNQDRSMFEIRDNMRIVWQQLADACQKCNLGKPGKIRELLVYLAPSNTKLYCIVLYCIVLYCIVLYCIVLYCIVLYCIVLYCIVLYCIVLYCIVLYCIVLYCMYFWWH